MHFVQNVDRQSICEPDAPGALNGVSRFKNAFPLKVSNKSNEYLF